MVILGLSSSNHGAAAALFVDQTVVAVVDEARGAYPPEASTRLPWTAAHQCLQHADLRPDQIDAVAIADGGLQMGTPAFWHHLSRQWQAAPVHAVAGLAHTVRQQQRSRAGWRWLLQQLGIDPHTTPLFHVERTLAQAHAGMVAHPTPSCVLSCNDTLTPTAALFGKSYNVRFERLSEIAQPDSLLQVMRCMGAYLGFDQAMALEGITLLARHGDPDRYNLNRLCTLNGDQVQINLQLLSPDGRRGWHYNGKRYPFTQKLVDWLGPPAAEAAALDPHAHYAAALLRYFWQTLLEYFTRHLGPQLRETPSVLLCGDAARARHVPATLLEEAGVASLKRSPFTGSTGAAIGAAARVAAQHGILVDRVFHPFLGPGFLQEECIAACRKHPSHPVFEVVRDPAKKAARLIAEGHAVGWLQGRAEAGALPLGGRAILQSPTQRQCPLPAALMGDEWSTAYAPVLSVAAPHTDRYTTDANVNTFASAYVALSPSAREWLPQALQIDGHAALQRVEKAHSPRLFHLLDELEKISGHGLVLQLPLQTPGEPRAISPADALDWFASSDAAHLIMEDVWIRKTK